MGAIPNFFIVGVAKGGTTFLHRSLARQSGIFMSEPKEPHHFADIEAGPVGSHTLNQISSERAYRALFARARTPVVGESSTTYWWAPGTPARLAELGADTRIAVSLRDPVERAFSHYLNDLRDGCEHRRFVDTVMTDRPPPGSLRWGSPELRIDLGFYADRLATYIDLFGDRLHVVIYEELVVTPEIEIARMLDFLGIEESAPDQIAPAFEETNAHRRPRTALSRRLLDSPKVRYGARRFLPHRVRTHLYDAMFSPAPRPEMEDEAATILAELYRADTARLEQTLGRILPWTTGSNRLEGSGT